MIYVFFPIIAAMCYGMAFAFMEKALKITNISTYMCLSALAGICVMFTVIKIKGEPLSFDFLTDKVNIAIVLTAVFAPTLGWLFTMFAIKTTSASYAAFAEISYPLFTLVFLFVFFGLRSVDWTVLMGGALIMLGSFIMIYGQTKT
jgi:drug/metabolite transporter (DMT)-like permease